MMHQITGTNTKLDNAEIPRFLADESVIHEIVYPRNLSSAELDEFIFRVEVLYHWYAPTDTKNDMKERFCHFPDTCVDLLVANEVVISFAVCAPIRLHSGEICLFRHGTLITKEFRSHGFYKHLIHLALKRTDATWHATRTQSPRVYETWKNIHGNQLWPKPGKMPNQTLIDIARELSRFNDTFDPRTFSVRRVYNQDHRGKPYQRTRSGEIETFFERSLGQYDAMILVARI